MRPAHVVRRTRSFAQALGPIVARRAQRFMPDVATLALVVTFGSFAIRVVAGCSATTARSVEAAALPLAEAACEAFLPMAVPNYGPAAVLGCKGADALIAGILGAVTPAPVVGQSVVLAWHPLRVGGRIAYMVQTTPEVAMAAQARLDAQTVRAR